MLDAHQITALQDRATLQWHMPGARDSPPAPTGLFPVLLLENHLSNFDLWHEEDKARDPLASEAEIASVKHRIDALNQRRNDLVEQMDDCMLLHAAAQNPAAPLHSETPGMIVDRLSILALKIFHTAEEAARESATPIHRQRNQQRLAILNEQRDDLALAFDLLWREIHAGRRRFRLYRQMKMYNDPDLNPAIYKH